MSDSENTTDQFKIRQNKLTSLEKNGIEPYPANTEKTMDNLSAIKFFSDNERKEELISELISLFNAYNNEKLTKEITDICENYISLIKAKINFQSHKIQKDHPSLLKKLTHLSQLCHLNMKLS